MLVSTIKNIIFDLGGVILDLSVDHTLESFTRLSNIPKSEVQTKFINSPGFNAYEKGLMTDAEFRQFVRDLYAVKADDHQIDECWNAMLRGIPKIKLELLDMLKETYNVFLLSNTNEIHLSYINTRLLPDGGTLDRYFHKSYYSHRMLLRKPEPEIFEHVLEENFLIPEETLFLDDNLQNVEAARGVGIKCVHVTTPDLILDYFHA